MSCLAVVFKLLFGLKLFFTSDILFSICTKSLEEKRVESEKSQVCVFVTSLLKKYFIAITHEQ